MYTDRIKVLHITDGNTVVTAIPHYLILDFLPTGHTALDKHLANHGVLQALDNNVNQLFLIVGNTATGTAHSVGWTHNQRITYFLSKFNCRSHILNNGRLRNRLPQLVHSFLEQLPILGLFNCLQRSAK